MNARRVVLALAAAVCAVGAWAAARLAVTVPMPVEIALSLTWVCLGFAVVAAFAVAEIIAGRAS